MKWFSRWEIFALASAFFAGLTAFLGKMGVMNVNSNLATFIRMCRGPCDDRLHSFMAPAMAMASGSRRQSLDFFGPFRDRDRSFLDLLLACDEFGAGFQGSVHRQIKRGLCYYFRNHIFGGEPYLASCFGRGVDYFGSCNYYFLVISLRLPARQANCVGVKSQLRTALRRSKGPSMLKQQSPPFLKSIISGLSLSKRQEIISVKCGSCPTNKIFSDFGK